MNNTALTLYITHTTRYEFEGPVFFEPHYFRFRPARRPYINVTEFNLQIDPLPTGISEFQDAESNSVQLCWFDDTHTEMNLKAVSKIEISEFNPFQFLIYPPEYMTYPFTYDENLTQTLAPYMKKINIEESLSTVGKRILEESAYDTFAFLKNLNKFVFEEFTVKYRDKGAPLNPDTSFKQKEGSCRDLSWMLIQLLRNMGYASRFTSGYFYFKHDNNVFDLHAWFDVYIPGAGWVGFDPSHGILAGAHHIPVCSSALPENTLPVSGNIRGKYHSTIQSKVTIDTY
jgi:transglutaminase-like putative cysteine protease